MTSRDAPSDTHTHTHTKVITITTPKMRLAACTLHVYCRTMLAHRSSFRSVVFCLGGTGNSSRNLPCQRSLRDKVPGARGTRQPLKGGRVSEIEEAPVRLGASVRERTLEANLFRFWVPTRQRAARTMCVALR